MLFSFSFWWTLSWIRCIDKFIWFFLVYELFEHRVSLTRFLDKNENAKYYSDSNILIHLTPNFCFSNLKFKIYQNSQWCSFFEKSSRCMNPRCGLVIVLHKMCVWLSSHFGRTNILDTSKFAFPGVFWQKKCILQIETRMINKSFALCSDKSLFC